MKRMILIGVSLAVLVAAGFWMAKRTRAAIVPEAAAIESAPPTTTESAESDSVPAPRAGNFDTPHAPPDTRATARRSSAIAPLPDPVANERFQLRLSVDRLVSPQISFEDKYRTWIKLRDEGKMDQVIAELNGRATNNPAAAEYPAALGQAYLHKIAVTKDTRDYAVLGALADRSFDAALDIDPASWDARFFKATAMSYWPEEMNKRPEVIQRFTQLIQDQEAQSPQPHFAQSYYWLGETYQKSGRSDYADQVWQRGAALFPADPMLLQKLAGR